MRTEEALQVVQEFIDTAMMIQFRNLRIIHGKGNGILRQMISQHSGPWFVAEALRASGLAAPDLESADVVWVDDYCYLSWWLGAAHSKEGMDPNPGDHLVRLYEEMVQLPRWLRNNGSDFVFFQPHPGWDGGTAWGHYQKFVCDVFR